MIQQPGKEAFLQIRVLPSRGLGQDRAAFSLPSLQLPPPALSTPAASVVRREQVSRGSRQDKGWRRCVVLLPIQSWRGGSLVKYAGSFKVPSFRRQVLLQFTEVVPSFLRD